MCCSSASPHPFLLGLTPLPAWPYPQQVAVVLSEKDVIRAHARDELGIGEPEQTPMLPTCCCAVKAWHVQLPTWTSAGQYKPA